MGSEDRPALDRRTVLAMLGTGSTLALAGCGGDSGGGDGTTSGEGTPGDTVPSDYETATALGGSQRDPGSLSSQDAVNYQTEPSDGEQCSGCTYYIEDKNGDGTGACAIVEGNIEPSGWCVSYVAHEGDGTAAEAVDIPQDANCEVCDMKVAKFSEWNAQAVHEDDTRAFFCTSGCATTYSAVPSEFAETDADIADIWMTGFESGEFIDGTSAYYALETDSDRLDDPMRLNPAPFADRADAVDYVDEVDYLTEDDIVELSAFDRDLASQYRAMHLDQ